MTEPKSDIRPIDRSTALTRPLDPWTYTSAELFELEYDALFLNRWQFVGHANDVTGIGDYMTADIGRDNVIVIRDKSNTLRAFLNVCRHRASRLLEGSGTCKGVLRCPYHGWTYQLDGSLMAVPQDEHFPDLDKSNYSLHAVQLEVFNGLVFVRIKGEGSSVAEQFAHTGKRVEQYGVVDYEKIAAATEQVWNCNWKVAWDNFLENYHIPIGHPGLHRLLTEDEEWDALTSGVDYGVFTVRDKLSKVAEERQYQELLPHADKRVPDELQNKWVQFGVAPSLGIDLYAEMLDMFQIIPLSVDKTMIRASFYGHKNPTAEEVELRRLNMLINDKVNTEDKQICERVQRGLATYAYRPGPLSRLEFGISTFHDMVRGHVPVAAQHDQPPLGSVAVENQRLAANERMA